MGLTFREFCSKEFEDALKKVCDFEHTIADKLKLLKVKKKVADEKENFISLSKEIADKAKADFEKSTTDDDKRKINETYLKQQQDLEKSPSDLDVSIHFDTVSKTPANVNDLHALLPVLTNVPDAAPVAPVAGQLLN